MLASKVDINKTRQVTKLPLQTAKVACRVFITTSHNARWTNWFADLDYSNKKGWANSHKFKKYCDFDSQNLHWL